MHVTLVLDGVITIIAFGLKLMSQIQSMWSVVVIEVNSGMAIVCYPDFNKSFISAK